MDIYLLLEICATVLSLSYLVLLIREKISCWWFGIAASVLSIFLFINAKLYSESILYTYYVLMGFYGYYIWSKNKTESNKGKLITRLRPSHAIALLIVGAILSAGLGYFFDTQSDAARPYLDAATTIFSFIATYLEARKVLGAWIFWIIINFTSIALYADRELNIYAALTLIYFIFSFVGFFKWRKSYFKQETN